MEKKHYRAVFISDIHLGTKACNADALLNFLRETSSDYLYLVGDIVDGWAMKRGIYFPQSHVNVLRKFLSRSNQGCKVVYISGNHDEAIRSFLPLTLGNIELLDETCHTTADGKKFLVIHGDQYDQVMQYARWVAWLGDLGYTFLISTNRYINWFRKKFGLGYWSLSAYAKRKVKTAASFIGDFETAVCHGVKQRGFDGVICGHIHHPEIKIINEVTYANDGDCCETCSALVEHDDGRIEIIYFAQK